jgi:hypothetical protein
VLGAAGAIAVSVATTLLTGVAQKAVGLDSPAPSAQASAAAKNTVPARDTPLVLAKATVVEDLDQDTWVAGDAVSLTPAESARISADKLKGAEQGDYGVYLQDMTRLGAVKTDAMALDLNLSTRLEVQVRIDRIRADFHCGAPLAGSIFFSPLAGPAVPIGKIGFDLDSPAPVARKLGGGDGGGQTFGSDFFADNVQYIKKNDGFAYRVMVRSTKRYCEFQLKIDATANGSSQTIAVGDHGGPFRVSGLVCDSTDSALCPKFPAYKRTYAGGTESPGGRWTPKDSNTYRG